MTDGTSALLISVYKAEKGIVRLERTGLPDLNVIHSTGIALDESGTLGFIGPRTVTLSLRNGQLVVDPFEVAGAAAATKEISTTDLSTVSTTSASPSSAMVRSRAMRSPRRISPERSPRSAPCCRCSE